MLLGFLSKSYLPPVKHIPSEANGFVTRKGNTTGQFVLLQELLFRSLDIAVDCNDHTCSTATGNGREGLWEGWSLVRRSPSECVCLCVCVCVCVYVWVSECLTVYDLETTTTRRPRSKLSFCATEKRNWSGYSKNMLTVQDIFFLNYVSKIVSTTFSAWFVVILTCL
jgi:hypothetical protein